MKATFNLATLVFFGNICRTKGRRSNLFFSAPPKLGSSFRTNPAVSLYDSGKLVNLRQKQMLPCLPSRYFPNERS